MTVIAVGGSIDPPPLVPYLQSPVTGSYADLQNTPPTFTWQYNPGQAGLTQTAFLFDMRVNGSGTQQFWNATKAIWQAAAVHNVGTPAYGTLTNQGNVWSYTFPTPRVITGATYVGTTVNFTCYNTLVAGQTVVISGVTGFTTNNPNGTWTVLSSGLSSSHFKVVVTAAPTGTYGTGGVFGTSFVDGNVYQWTISSQDTNGNGPIANYSLVTAQRIPVVTVTAPFGVVAQANPTIIWGTTFAPGASQLTYQVFIYTSAQTLAPGWVPGQAPYVYATLAIGSNATTLDLTNIPLYLPTGVDYYAFVQVMETNGLLSDINYAGSYTEFNTVYTPPTTAALTATASVDPTTKCPRVNLTTTGGTLTGQAIILRSDGAYVRGASVTNPYTITGTGNILVYDYEPVPTVAYTYRLQIIHTTGTAITASAPVTSGSVTITTTGWWEVDPNSVSGAVNAQAIAWQPQITEQSTARLVMGQATPNIVASTMGGKDGQATFETFDPATYVSLQALLTSQSTVFVSSPWGPTDTTYLRFGPQTGGGGGAGGNKVNDSTLLPSTFASMHRTTQVTFVAQARPPV